MDAGAIVDVAVALPGTAIDAASVADAWPRVLRRGWIHVENGTAHLTDAGARWLGLTAPTGAVRESTEHRRLILGAFRVFARRGYRLEIVRQGRFDTSLPDARYRQIPAALGGESPESLARSIERLRSGWAWRYFHGRDVHVEAEVSGALRGDRIRRGLAKARHRSAIVLFVVGEAAHARRVRGVLERAGAGREEAIVWALARPGSRPKCPPGLGSP